MLTALWSAKGGQGVSVTSALVAQSASRSAKPSSPVLLVDLRGDQAAIFGVKERSLVQLSPTLYLLMSGDTPLTASRADELAEYLKSKSRESAVVVDLGAPSGDEGTEAFRQAIIDRCDESVLVTRNCYLALRRSVNLANRPTKMVVVSEPGRALTTSDCEWAVDAKAVTTVHVDPDIARAVDAGMLTEVPNKVLRNVGRIASSPAAAEPAANGGIDVSVSPAQASPSEGSRLCGHPLPDGGTCSHRVTGRKKCAAGHPPK